MLFLVLFVSQASNRKEVGVLIFVKGGDIIENIHQKFIFLCYWTANSDGYKQMLEFSYHRLIN